MKIKKYCFFIGTTAELVKLFPIMLVLKERNIEFTIISSGQNDLMEDSIIETFNLPKPIFTIRKHTNNQTPIGLLFWTFSTFIVGFFKVGKYIINNKPTYFIVHGDTLSTLIGAVLGKIFFRTVVHIESGLRSFNLFRPFPEEIDRLLTFQFTDIYVCPNEKALKNVEKYRGKKINSYHNTALDSIKYAFNKIENSDLPIEILQNKKYFCWIMHRPENLSNKEYVDTMWEIIKTILQTKEDTYCLFYLHPNTKTELEKMGYYQKIIGTNKIITTPRISYIPNISLLKYSQFVITDGGGNQEECYFMGKPCIVARKETERNEGLGENAILTTDQDKILDFIDHYSNYVHDPVFSKISPSEIIVNSL